MAQMSGVSVTCGHAFETRGSSHIVRRAKPFFILEVCGPQRTTGHVAAPEPSRARRQDSEPWDTWQRQIPHEQGGGIRSSRTRGSAGALSSRDARSGAVGHVVVSEPSRARRQDLEPRDSWQRWSPPEQEGMIQCCRACGSTSSLSWTQAYMWGYLVCRVPTVAPEPTSGEVMKPQVGPTYLFLARLF
jgi:hypothetical protein